MSDQSCPICSSVVKETGRGGSADFYDSKGTMPARSPSSPQQSNWTLTLSRHSPTEEQLTGKREILMQQLPTIQRRYKSTQVTQ